MPDQTAATTAREALEVAGDIGPATGPMNCPGDMHVVGSILDQLQAQAQGSIRVGQSVGAAEVRAGVDLCIAGGLAGRDKGRCVAGRNVQARYVSGAVIVAGGDVLVESGITGSRVLCEGTLRVAAGPILACKIQAARGVRCGTLGSRSSVPTFIHVGFDHSLHALAAQALPRMKAKLRDLESLQQTCGPLLINQKDLSPSQKEQVTEMLFAAGEIRDEMVALGRSLQQRCAAQARLEARIVFDELLYPGVVARFPGYETTIAATWRGPASLQVGKHQGQTRILLVDAQTRSSQALPTMAVADPVLDEVRRLLVRLLDPAAPTASPAAGPASSHA